MNDKTKLAESINQIFIKANQKTDIEGIKLTILEYLDKTQQNSEYLYDSVVNAVENRQFSSLRGFCEANGIGTKPNQKLALQFFMRGALLGDEISYGGSQNSYLQLRLANYYRAQKNYEPALHWLKNSASLGNPRAYLILGKMYHESEGITRNYEKSFRAWKKAANINSKYQSSAQNLLAIYYYRGRGTNKDMHAAIKTHRIATSNGKSTYFSKLLRIIFKKLR
ncbi:9296_t:CDS:2 [Ambispora leptoticha]|uniref:9296_t:CDS:1 n=1 Tax=Ambispora leptoticha TaxID=144679 RepID=A0A9N9F1I3_9GLOM|nr:9296_t:CDS:2 [Ambispora leptoticha]